ncbi:SEFIR domain-containing protein [Nocardioides sp. W7]|uniref:SEFIR domain-containing protein n=1 Tax=Nocardioides sp. W7 TaxID=2931390 RepID=UPI001FD072A9|nr:SEFIR domain-containing protein [Nocardioides sp. W7]
MAIRVFISYTHDSDAHRQSVLDLADRLRREGLDVSIDRWVNGTPLQGWPAWMEDEVEAADFTLVVCTPSYYERYRNHGDPTTGKGGRWESILIRDRIYADTTRRTRYVPVLIGGADQSSVPEVLRESVTRYRIPDEYNSLYRYLTGQPEDVAPPIGSIRHLPPTRSRPDGARPDPTPPDPTRAPPLSRRGIVVGEIPGQPRTFVERRAVERLARQLDRSNVVLVSALTGMRGVGKTQVAAAYARAAATDGCPLVAWVNADSEDNLIAGLARTAERAGVVTPQASPREAAHQLREHLATWDLGGVLVLDNAADPDTVRSFLPPTGLTKVVITSTDRAFDELAATIDVDTYDRADSIAYLHRSTGHTDDAGADRVAHELGDLPLALASVGPYIRHRRLDYDRCLRDLRAYPVAQTLANVRGIGYPDPTAAALLLAVDSVDTDDDRRIAGTILEIIATLSPEGVRRDLLERVTGADHATWTTDQIDHALERCVTGSVLTWSESGDSVIMHRLMARVIRERTESRGRRAQSIDGALDLLGPGFAVAPDSWRDRGAGLHAITHLQAVADAVLETRPPPPAGPAEPTDE